MPLIRGAKTVLLIIFFKRNKNFFYCVAEFEANEYRDRGLPVIVVDNSKQGKGVPIVKKLSF